MTISLTSEQPSGNSIKRRSFESILDANFKSLGVIKEKDRPDIQFEINFFENKISCLECIYNTNIMMRYKTGIVSGLSKDKERFICLWGELEDKRQVKIFERWISESEDVERHLYVGMIDKITGIVEGKLETGEKFIMKCNKFKATTT